MKPTKSSILSRKRLPFVIVICFGILSSISVFLVVRNREFLNIQEEFNHEGWNRINSLQRGMELYKKICRLKLKN